MRAASPSNSSLPASIPSEASTDTLAQYAAERSAASVSEKDQEAKQTSLQYPALVAKYPRVSLCGFCCSCTLFLGLLLLAMQTGSRIYFEISPPFYVVGHTTYEREDALIEASKTANSIPPFFLNESTGKVRVARLPRETTTHEVKIIYEAPAGENIWDLKHLKTIADIEARILQSSGKNSKGDVRKYSDYCQLVYKGSTTELLNPASPCKAPLSPIGFLWKSWIPLPYQPFKWVDPKVLKEPALSCPLNMSTLATEGDPVRALLVSLLPANNSVDELLALARNGKICQAGSQIKENLTCDQFNVCFALLQNTADMKSWAHLQNSMWDYAAIESYYQANIDSFLDYWSRYNSNDVNSSSTDPFIYGTLVQQGDDQLLYANALPNMIRTVADASFGMPLGGRSGRAVMSTFYFGGPLENIDESWDSLGGDALTEQNADFQDWAFNAMHTILMDAYEEKPGGLKIVWSAKDKISGSKDPMYLKYAKSYIVPQDMRWLLAAFVFVLIYVAYQARSIFLSLITLGTIVIGIIPTAALYVLVCRQTYFGVLQILSLFLILGIGVDGVFVLLEFYKQHRNSNRPLAQDLSAAWAPAAKAVLCTSATTFFSFVANTTSSFPAVHTFGIWCCALIVVNYISMNTVLLAALAVYDKYLKNIKFCRFCPVSTEACLPISNALRGSSCCTSAASMCKGSDRIGSGVHRTGSRRGQFIDERFFGFIRWARFPLVALWLGLFVLYVVCALHLKPDPAAPKILPDEDPYMQWTDTVVEHFGAINNPKLITTKLIFGIDREMPLDRAGTDTADVLDRGAVQWSGLRASDAEWRQAQTWLTDLCADLQQRAGEASDVLRIQNRQTAVQCPWSHLKTWALQQGHVWPAPTYRELEALVSIFLRSRNPEDPNELNYDRWSSNLFFVEAEDEPFGVEPKLFTIDVQLSVESDVPHKDGMKLWHTWEDYCQQWRESAPSFLKSSFYHTDSSGFFHWFFLQEQITTEAYEGMALALGFACVVLVLATRNLVVAFAAIACICSIVTSVVAFMFLAGWKLGVLEALVLVMVIGLSVDYVVHMADSYLEAPFETRLERTKYMMQKMGLAVLNGATTTICAALFMCATYITFFQKFGIVILVTVLQSLVTSMFFFSAMMAAMGPEASFGSVSYAALRSGRCIRGAKAQMIEDVEAIGSVSVAEQRDDSASPAKSVPVLLGATVSEKSERLAATEPTKSVPVDAMVSEKSVLSVDSSTVC